MIYLDNASTTMIDQEVLNVYQEIQLEAYYNSESLHIGGIHTRQLLDKCKHFIKDYFSTNKEVIYTRSGSQANEIAIHSFLKGKIGSKVMVSPYEHPSIYAALESYQDDYDIEMLPLDDNGEIDLEQTSNIITEDVVLIVAQHVNSETGYILPVEELSEIAINYNIPIHVDGVQAVHKIDNINVERFSSYTFSGHKFHGTKGSGVLLINHEFVKPLNQYYFHEMYTQNGTIDAPSIIAMTKALSMSSNIKYINNLQQYFIEQLNELSFTPIVYKAQAPHIMALLTPIFEGQYIMQYLSNRNICISTGTACGHGALLSNGLQAKIDTIPEKTYDQYIRLSIGKFTTRSDIDTCLHHLKTVIRGDQ